MKVIFGFRVTKGKRAGQWLVPTNKQVRYISDDAEADILYFKRAMNFKDAEDAQRYLDIWAKFHGMEKFVESFGIEPAQLDV